MTIAAEVEESALESLKPIRDLAKNWDIDIAACLEEYLQEMTGDLDMDHPRDSDGLNFSEAALVLQNSSSVYSRKVEYLYGLVLQVYEELIKSAGNKTTKEASNRNKTRAERELDEFHAFDPNVQFLLLDDVLPIDQSGTNINLQKGSNRGENHTGARDHGMSFATAQSSNTRLSLGMTFATERSGGSSSHGVAHCFGFGSIHDAGRLRLIDGNCDIGEDGILIVPGAGGTLGDRKARRSSFLPSPLSDHGGDGDGAAGLHLSQDGARQVDFGSCGDGSIGIGGAGDDYYGFDDGDDGGGGGLELNTDDYVRDEIYNGLTPVDDEATQKRAKVANNVQGQSTMKSKFEDPWEQLDPHSQDSSKRRPLRTGKTYRLPPGVADIPSQSVTGASTKPQKKQHPAQAPETLKVRQSRVANRPIVLQCLQAKLAAHQKNKSDEDGDDGDAHIVEPEIPLMESVYGEEFSYIAKEMSKRRARQKKAEKERALRNGDIEQQDKYVDDGFGYGNDNAGYASPDYCCGDDDDGGIIFNDDGNDVFGRVGMPLGDTSVGGSTDSAIGSKTFEELCRQHIQEFARKSSAYATETKLTKRVGEWHKKLVPILEMEEKRHEFDIFQYTQHVVDTILEAHEDKTATERKIIHFREATLNRPSYEVCRLFLASLSLANSENILLHHENDGDSELHLELLNSAITNPMERYFAPSVLDQEE